MKRNGGKVFLLFLKTVLNDNITISAGQKQLLTIARAMVEDAPMLILDKATSSVDTRTELKIQQAMDRLTSDRTSFVIAHRLSTILWRRKTEKMRWRSWTGSTSTW